MQISIVTGLLVIIVIVSIKAWNDTQIYQKFLFSPREIKDNGEWLRFITSGFIHADYMHLGFNMFALLMFGQPLLDIMKSQELFGNMGDLAFSGLFILGIIFSHLPDYWRYKDGYYKSLGASGGVSSIVFAYVLINPLAKLGLLFIPIYIPGFIFASLYLIYSYQKAKVGNDNIGHTAHFVGSIFGLVFMLAFHPWLLEHFWGQIKDYSLSFF